MDLRTGLLIRGPVVKMLSDVLTTSVANNFVASSCATVSSLS